jgi:hypothetical protein
MTPRDTATATERAHGRVSAYVSSGIGAISPGRWQFVQFLKKSGATSLLNVGTPSAAAPWRLIHTAAAVHKTSRAPTEPAFLLRLFIDEFQARTVAGFCSF